MIGNDNNCDFAITCKNESCESFRIVKKKAFKDFLTPNSCPDLLFPFRSPSQVAKFNFVSSPVMMDEPKFAQPIPNVTVAGITRTISMIYQFL